jgi:Hypervirulence associated proteins TUDOR domain
MSQEFKKGDRVTWKSHGGSAEGEVLRKITEDTELAGRKVRASKDDPQYLVRSNKSGGEAVHKPSALRNSALRNSALRNSALKKKG